MERSLSLTLGHSERVPVTTMAPSTFDNPYTDVAKVRVIADVAVHVVPVTKAGSDEATDEDCVLAPYVAAYVDLGPLDNLSLLAVASVSGVKEEGTIEFNAVADAADELTLDDGDNAPVTFTFGDGTGGTVNRGATATASAIALEAAIQVEVDAENLNLEVSRSGTTVTVRNKNFVGGQITKDDADDDYTVTDFSGGSLASGEAGNAWVTRVR